MPHRKPPSSSSVSAGDSGPTSQRSRGPSSGCWTHSADLKSATIRAAARSVKQPGGVPRALLVLLHVHQVPVSGWRILEQLPSSLQVDPARPIVRPGPQRLPERGVRRREVAGVIALDPLSVVLEHLAGGLIEEPSRGRWASSSY